MFMQPSSAFKKALRRRKKNKRRRNHIDDLSVLPVFLNLQGCKTVVIGNSDGAAWKAELLSASGAYVHVFSNDPGEEMKLFLSSGHSRDAHVTWYRGAWNASSLQGATIVITDIEEEDALKKLRAAANKAGALLNAIDQPDHCQFQFGSIVNRSPVVVSISTSGAAPILGQAVRRHIEAILPRSLQAWAKLAHSIRSQVNDQLAPGPKRRTFWEAFVDRAFSGEPPKPDDLPAVISDIKSNRTKVGSLVVIEAPSEAADLMTMRAVRYMQSADVVFHEASIGDDILALARREAKFVSMGDECGSSITEQETLDRAAILADQGQRSVLLVHHCGSLPPANLLSAQHGS